MIFALTDQPGVGFPSAPENSHRKSDSEMDTMVAKKPPKRRLF
jgi:hypothetical protein